MRFLGWLLLTCGLSAAAFAAERTVLCEKFTATWCGPCKTAGGYLADILDDNPDRFAFVHLHSEDALETQFVLDRRCFYGYCDPAYSFPTTVMNGELRRIGAYGADTYVSDFNQLAAQETDVTIEAWAESKTQSTWTITAAIGVEASGSAKTMRLFVVQVLDHYPGNEKWERNAFLQAAPVQTITVNPGQITEIDTEFTFGGVSMSRPNDIKIIIWLQEVTDVWPAEVYQAHTMSWPFPGSPDDPPVGDYGMQVTPSTPLTIAGPIGGPFSTFGVYQVRNVGSSSVSVNVASSAPWLTTDATEFSVPPGQVKSVLAFIDPAADLLPGGEYTAVLDFINLNDVSSSASRQIVLSVEDCDGNGQPDNLDAAGNDCNGNGRPDGCDLADGQSADCNGNGLPDECEAFAPINVTQQPQGAVVVEAQPLTLSASASDALPLTYQWRLNNVDIPGATAAQLQIAQISAASAGNYTVRIATDCQSVVSNVAKVVVVPTLQLNVTAGPTFVAPDQPMTLTASTTGGQNPISFLWSTGATTPSITVSPAVTSNYSVTATDALGQSATRSISATVVTKLSCVVEATQTQVAANQAVTLSAKATFAVAPLTYLWSTGETTASITVRPSATTTYEVEVLDPLGQKTKAAITIGVASGSSDQTSQDLPDDAGETGDDHAGGTDDDAAGLSAALCPSASLALLFVSLAGLVRSRRR